jgi:hypothetical protein
MSVLVEFDAQLEFTGCPWCNGQWPAMESIGLPGCRPLHLKKPSRQESNCQENVWSSQSVQPGRVDFKLRLTRRRSKTNASEESI